MSPGMGIKLSLWGAGGIYIYIFIHSFINLFFKLHFPTSIMECKNRTGYSDLFRFSMAAASGTFRAGLLFC